MSERPKFKLKSLEGIGISVPTVSSLQDLLNIYDAAGERILWRFIDPRNEESVKSTWKIYGKETCIEARLSNENWQNTGRDFIGVTSKEINLSNLKIISLEEYCQMQNIPNEYLPKSLKS